MLFIHKFYNCPKVSKFLNSGRKITNTYTGCPIFFESQMSENYGIFRKKCFRKEVGMVSKRM